MQYSQLQLKENSKVTLRCYLQDDSPEMSNMSVRPAVLVLPGGGYRMCSDREAEPIALAFLAMGYHAFVLRYTVGEDTAFESAFEDAERALEMLHQNAEEWRLDASRIAVTGFSAGGHLAAALGTMGKKRPSALILGYPCILESSSTVLGRSVPGMDQKVDANTPPAFIFGTSADSLVPVQNALAFAGAMAEAGRPFALHIYQNGGHGLSLGNTQTSMGKPEMENPIFAGWTAACDAWLRENWRTGKDAD